MKNLKVLGLLAPMLIYCLDAESKRIIKTKEQLTTATPMATTTLISLLEP